MTSPDRYGDIAEILRHISDGDLDGFDRLLPLVYAELRSLADQLMRKERDGHTLQATALTHEAYLRLRKREPIHWQDRTHFLAVAAQAMRQILVDHARAKRSQKRGGDREQVPLEDLAGPEATSQIDVLALDQALSELSGIAPRAARVVELLYFGGLTRDEAAAVLRVTRRTVHRDWRYARGWLLRALSEEPRPSPAPGTGGGSGESGGS